MTALQREPIVRSVPSVRDIKDPKVREVLEALKENVELLTGDKSRKTTLDKAVTLRELHQYGLANLVINGNEIVNANPDNSFVKAPVNQTINEITEVGGTDLDLTPPATLTGLTAQATQTGVLVQFDDPDNSLYAYAEIWGASVDDFSQASLIGTTDGFIYPDFIGASGVTRYYWVRPVSINNVLGAFNDVSGVGATTGTAVDDNVLNSDSANFLNANIAHANIYSINASKITSGTIRANRYIAVGKGTYGIVIDGQGNIRSGQTGYATGLNGFFMGQQGGNTKVSIGSGSNYLRFDGTRILINTPDLVLNSSGATFSGTLTSASMVGGDINIGSNKFVVGTDGAVTINSGNYTGYAWPPVGSNGYHLSAAGALWGSYYDGRYFQITQAGNIYAPGFNVVNGVMTINQANVIETLNLAGNAVTVDVIRTFPDQSISNNANGFTTLGTVLNTTHYSAQSVVVASLSGEGRIQQNEGHQVNVRLLHNGTVVRTVMALASANSDGFGIWDPARALISIPFYITPTSGANSYEVQVQNPNDSNPAIFSNMILHVVEGKK